MAPPARPHSLRIIEQEPFPSLDESAVVEVPSNEIAPGITLEDGVLHSLHEDGSTTIDFNPQPQTKPLSPDDGFYANLVDKIEQSSIGQISSELLDGINRDIESRKEWLDTRARGIQLLGLKLEEPRGDVGTSSAPLEGQSTVRHPLLLDATVNFQATARGELLPATGPVKVRNDTPSKSPSQTVPAIAPPQPFQQGGGVVPGAPGAVPPPQTAPAQQSAEPTPQQPENPAQQAAPFATEIAIPPMEEQDSLAAALEKDMNHYLTVTAREYYPDTDRMLFYVGFGGDGFKKVYNCPLRNRPVSESVDAEDLIVSNSAIDLSNCGRVTHRIRMRKSIVKRMQILGAYADVDLGTPAPEKMDPVKEERQEIEGHNPLLRKPEDQDYTIYECYCELDLDEFAPAGLKGKGLPLPYRVTIEETSRKVLSVVRNWNEDDEQALPKQFFVQYPFIRGLGFYGLGFVHLLGNTTSTLTAGWREALDAGMFSNFPGFLYADWAGRQLTNQFRIPPGGGQKVSLPQMSRIQDAVMPLPYKDVSGAFVTFLQWVEQAGQRLGQTGQIAVGEGKQEVPVGTTLALIEQATKIINSAHKRLHAAQAEEFMLLKERFREDPEAFWRSNKKPSLQWEKEQFLRALDDYNIIPVADPNNPTSLHRAAKAQIIEGTASKYPQLINGQAALKRIYRIAGIDTEGLFYDKPLPPPPDPRMVAIQQKAQSTQQTVQAQTQSTVAKTIAQVILGMKQVEQKTTDSAARNQIDQLRLTLEALERRADMANEQQRHAQELIGDRIRTQQKLAADDAWTQQELDADRRKTMHQMGTEMIGKAQEGRMEQMKATLDYRAEQQRARQDLAMERMRHSWEMQRDREKHTQEMELAREKHQAELAQQRALARIKPKGQNKTTTKTTKSNTDGTRKTETTQTKED